MSFNIPTDKAAHFGLSSVGVEVLIKSCPLFTSRPTLRTCQVPASLGIFALGVIKESSDKAKGRTFDHQDLVANTLGIVTGNLLQWEF